MEEPGRRIIFPLYFLSRMIRWYNGDRSPLIASLKITKKCTLKCKHCPWIYGEKEELPVEQWKHIIYDLKKQGVRGVVIEGGEPLLYKDLNELIAFCKNLKLTTTIATNATMSLAGYYPDKFYVSIDGMEEQHDALRGNGAFKKMTENLNTTSIDIIALISISRLNRHSIEDMLEYFSSKVSGFWFSFMYEYEASDNIALSSSERKEIGSNLLELKDMYNIVNLNSYLKNAGRKRRCRDWLMTTVTSDGRIRQGCMIETLEECDCSECDLACHRELSDIAGLVSPIDNIKDYIKRIRKNKS